MANEMYRFSAAELSADFWLGREYTKTVAEWQGFRCVGVARQAVGGLSSMLLWFGRSVFRVRFADAAHDPLRFDPSDLTDRSDAASARVPLQSG